MNTLQSEKKLKEVGEFYSEIAKTNQDYLNYWLNNTLFHWDFWVSLIIFTIVPIVFWIKIRKKESSNRLLFSGMFVFIISSWFDFLGVQTEMVLYRESNSFYPLICTLGLGYYSSYCNDLNSG